MEELIIRSDAATARINTANGQLCGLRVGETGIIHPGGASDASNAQRESWGNSEIILFPLVGPAHHGELRMQIGEREERVRLPQHGISRYLPWEVASHEDDRVVLRQSHDADTAVQAGGGTVAWPFSFSLTKDITLDGDGVSVRLTLRNRGAQAMPYMLGWHPSFRADDDGVLSAGAVRLSLQELGKKEGSVAYAEAQSASYVSGRATIAVDTDFPRMMLWTRGQQFCIEPVTDFQDPAGTRDLTEDHRVLASEEEVTHTVRIAVDVT